MDLTGLQTLSVKHLGPELSRLRAGWRAQLRAVSLEPPLGGGGGTLIPRTGAGEESLSAG